MGSNLGGCDDIYTGNVSSQWVVGVNAHIVFGVGEDSAEHGVADVGVLASFRVGAITKDFDLLFVVVNG